MGHGKVKLASPSRLTRLRRPRHRGVSISGQQDDVPGSKAVDNSGKTEDAAATNVGAPYVLAASVLIGCALGYALDEYYGTSPAWTITLFFVFMVIGFYQLVKNLWR